jgi:hypothetical protein
MARKFSEKYGLDKDRIKLTEGLEFIIIGIPSVHASRAVGEDGKTYDIAEINGKDKAGNLLKFYDTSSVIVEQCRDMLKDARPDGTLKEEMEVKTVLKTSKKKRDYLAFE